MTFLETGSDPECPQLPDRPSVIIGAGRIGDLLNMLAEAPGDDVVLRRGDSFPNDLPKDTPIYVATRNDVLESVIEMVPEERREDLVFLQNGMLEPFLRKHGLADPKTSIANIYFAVPKLGADPIDGKTPSSPDGLTCATGKWAHAFAERLHRGGLSCTVAGSNDFRRSMLEKLIWICVFMLIGSVHGNKSVGDVATFHRKEVDEMVTELGHFVKYTLAVGMLPDLTERLCQYAMAVKDFPTAVKEFEWRNGYFYEWSMLARKKGVDDQLPMHTEYLESGKEMGKINF